MYSVAYHMIYFTKMKNKSYTRSFLIFAFFILVHVLEASPSIETALENYPLFVTQKSGKRVPIVQAYAYTKYLGRLFVEFDENGDVISAKGNPVLLDSSIPEDPQVNRLVESWINPLKNKLKVVKGYLRVPLLRPNVSALEFESNAGNFITDALLHYGVKHATEGNASTWTNAPIAIYNRGGIRSDLTVENEGAVTLGDLYVMIPFQRQLHEVKLLGSSLLKALEYTVTTDDFNHIYPILDFSGLRVVYDLEQPAGHRVSSVFVECKKCSIPRYEKLNPNETYTVLMTDYLLHGGSNFKMFPNESLRIAKINQTDTSAVIEYVEKLQYIYPRLEGRLTVSIARATVDDSKATVPEIYSDIVVILLGCVVLVMTFTFFFYICKAHKNVENQYQRLDS